MLFFVKKVQKNLVMSKKCSTFAPAFEKKPDLVMSKKCSTFAPAFEKKPGISSSAGRAHPF